MNVEFLDGFRSGARGVFSRTAASAAVRIGPCSRLSIAAPTETTPAVGERELEATDTLADTPWLVIVWNDPINLMSYVTYVFQKLFGYSLEKATKLMLDVHKKGRAVVSSGTREKAELDVSRLHHHGLWATMEQS